ncbi:MAG TPA: helix-turn-helix transcriptional regulator [Thermoanaerobacterales bacterium]|nr:helix-turn-helix transcriptional regulator [Thermoanaerobacterales bacterium]
MDYSKLVKTLREKLILTQSELAEMIGVSFTTVNRWENGKHEPTIKIRRKIVEICKANNIDMVEKKNKNYQLD